VPKVQDLPREERAAATENARRQARFLYMEARVKKIVDGAPALTAEQRAHLARILLRGGGSE
jgi:hypothetical protein